MLLECSRGSEPEGYWSEHRVRRLIHRHTPQTRLGSQKDRHASRNKIPTSDVDHVVLRAEPTRLSISHRPFSVGAPKRFPLAKEIAVKAKQFFPESGSRSAVYTVFAPRFVDDGLCPHVLVWGSADSPRWSVVQSLCPSLQDPNVDPSPPFLSPSPSLPGMTAKRLQKNIFSKANTQPSPPASGQSTPTPASGECDVLSCLPKGEGGRTRGSAPRRDDPVLSPSRLPSPLRACPMGSLAS